MECKSIYWYSEYASCSGFKKGKKIAEFERRFNRYIVECKWEYSNTGGGADYGFNRYIVECK